MAHANASTDVNMLSHELVEVAHDAQDGSGSEVERILTSTDAEQPGDDPNLTAMQFDGPPAQRSPSHTSPSHGAPSIPFPAFSEILHEKAVKRDGLAVIVPPPQHRWEYKVFQEADEVKEILEEYDDAGFLEYLVLFADGSEDVISFDNLRKLSNGPSLIANFGHQGTRDSSSGGSALSSDDELTMARPSKSKLRSSFRAKGSKPTSTSRTLRQRESQSQMSTMSLSSQSDGDDYVGKRKRPSAKVRGERATRVTAMKRINYSDVLAPEDALDDESDDDLIQGGKRKRSSSRRLGPSKSRKLVRGHRESDSDLVKASRRSDRNLGRSRDMREVGEDDIPETATGNHVARYAVAKEVFKELASDDEFRLRHLQICDICREEDDNEVKGVLVFCQGCTTAFHQKCLGPRTGREHLVTKIAPNSFVLQCRRCVGIAKNKDSLAPDQGLCFTCHEPGSSTTAFRERKSAKEEQREREDNGGEDPITDVLTDLINNPKHVLFRCTRCYRACHVHHLSQKSETSPNMHEEAVADARFEEYTQDWQCKDCVDAPGEIESLVAWRPTNMDRYQPGQTTDVIEEDVKEYLVKWKKMSYFKVQWMPGAWVWGVAASATIKAFAKRDNVSNLPKMSTEEAVPEDFLRVDIVFDVEYTNIVNAPSEKVAKARIKEIRKVFVKFKGLGYEDAVWTEPPSPEDTERWTDFRAAYDDWVMGSYIRPPTRSTLSTHLNKVRAQNFGDELAMKSQPESLIGGELMAYQMEGLNWLYYQWFKKKNAILADEMGLGKTIQVIGFLAALKQLHGCWPFLVVVPNSTCPNWRREIKHWAPSLRVVTYYGSARARKLALDHELFPGGGKDLRCHIVVTSYEAAQETEFRSKFKGISWQGLIVDEGQRLKNDKNILYGALNALKSSFKLLLTGTPLQNNARELFNLLQFLDPSIDAEAMEEEYTTLTKENVAQLHDKLRNFFLRRTKAGVLKFLPSMAQIIIPVTMSVVQKKLYKSIIAKNPDLIKSIVGPSKRALGKSERASLNNILMQLRKCLAHPFVYSRDIEERSSNKTISHRNLVEASSKLQLLEIMLPKLQERGHRVLIFSQFLDMLDMVEDFLTGLGLFYQRLDGSVGSLQKQKRIDEFNAPNSPLFAFLLSTRAGGVGINLATADTVIILDPDFNPHQDIQALSRAHRIGQKKKVLVFQLTTRNTAEEKIMQIGKKKMALDHVLIEQMAAEDDAGMDLESILKYGAEALFNDDDTQDIRYDPSSVDKLLDRSQIEDTQAGNDESAESQFSFARVWANDKGVLEDSLGNGDVSETEVDPSLWDNILEERKREAEAEAAARTEDFGRGRRKRQTVDYSKQAERYFETSPVGTKNGRRAKDSDSDTDFQERDESEEEPESEEEGVRAVASHELEPNARRPRSVHGSLASSPKNNGPVFVRAQVLPISPGSQIPRQIPVMDGANSPPAKCPACDNYHLKGRCPLKLAGVENCPLCGIAHYGRGRICPHINSITQLQAMHEALKQSPEHPEIKELAKKKVTGLIGSIRQKRRIEEEAKMAKEKQALRQSSQTRSNFTPVQHGRFNGPGFPRQMNGGDVGKENRMAGSYVPAPYGP